MFLHYHIELESIFSLCVFCFAVLLREAFTMPSPAANSWCCLSLLVSVISTCVQLKTHIFVGKGILVILCVIYVKCCGSHRITVVFPLFSLWGCFCLFVWLVGWLIGWFFKTGFFLVALAVLELASFIEIHPPPASASQVLGLKACTTTAWPVLYFKSVFLFIALAVLKLIR